MPIIFLHTRNKFSGFSDLNTPSVSENVTKLVGGVGEINFGKQYRQGNRVYSGNHITMALTASPLGNTGGYSYLYLIKE